MLIKISKLLSDADLGRIRVALETAQFADGASTGKKSLKRNLQAVQSSPGLNDATKTIVAALMRRREFTSYVIPKQVFMMFNRYDMGMVEANPLMGCRTQTEREYTKPCRSRFTSRRFPVSILENRPTTYTRL